MISEVQERRIAVCVAKKSREVTNAALAREFGVSEVTIKKDLEWGRRSGLYEIENAQQIEVRIVEVSDEITRLEKMAEVVYENAMQYMKDTQKRRSLITDFVPLVKEIREQRVLLMELQGLYRQNVNVHVESKSNVLVLPQTIDNMDEWMRAVQEVTQGDMEATKEASLSAISQRR